MLQMSFLNDKLYLTGHHCWHPLNILLWDLCCVYFGWDDQTEYIYIIQLLGYKRLQGNIKFI